ncbi:MAG: metal-dependent hydrolase [Haloferacaceae archaeon]
MFVGHALLAFSLVAGAAGAAGTGRRRALTLGVAAGAFAAVPDVDIAYALVGVAGAGTAPPLAMAHAFWSTGNAVHRTVTHSVLVALPAAVAAAAWGAGVGGRRGGRAVALVVVLALVALVAAVSGVPAAAVTVLFGGALLGVATLVVRRGGLEPRAVLVTALVGLVSHPFGDLFTGTPPAFLYPLSVTLVPARIALAADPTLDLLAAFGMELATAWLAVLVVAWLSDVRVRPSPRATVGIGYAAVLPVLPAPTLDLSYPFVFGALAVGLLALLPAVVGAWDDDATRAVAPLAPRAARALLTALTAVTFAWAAYAAAYAALAM